MKIKLTDSKIIYNEQARSGEWCCKEYSNHKYGCPNFPKCINQRIDFNNVRFSYHWYAVIEEFNLQEHAEIMKTKHPKWTERQCRNLLYWQGSVRKKLKEKVIVLKGDIVLDIPEANGIHVFNTMENHGIGLERINPVIIRKIMFIGYLKISPQVKRRKGK